MKRGKCSVFAGLCIVERAHNFFNVFWARDGPDTTALDRAFHADLLANEVSAYFSRTYSNIAAHFLFFVQILDALPPLHGLDAAACQQIFQLFFALVWFPCDV